MIDMSKTIIAKSDQLNADDLIGKPITVKITKVSEGKDTDQPILIHYDGDNGKPYKPSKGMRRVMVRCWGSDGEAYVGRSMTLFNNPDVKWAGKEVGGIQISHVSHIDKPITMALAISRAVKQPYRIMPLAVDNIPKPSVELLEQGLEAAQGGKDAYTAWLGSLNDIQKESIRPKHKEWTAIALSVPQEEDEVEL